MTGFRPFCVGFGVLAITGLIVAQPSGDSPPAKSTPSARPHTLSPEVTEAISAKLPKYTLKEADPTVTSGESIEENDSRVDVLRLKKVVVSTPQIARLSPDDMLSGKGRIDEALKKLPGLLIGPLAFLNRGIAALLANQDRDVAKSSSLLESARNATAGDASKEAKRINNLAKAAAERSTWP